MDKLQAATLAGYVADISQLAEKAGVERQVLRTLEAALSVGYTLILDHAVTEARQNLTDLNAAKNKAWDDFSTLLDAITEV